jgi:hypothetical protein
MCQERSESRTLLDNWGIFGAKAAANSVL